MTDTKVIHYYTTSHFCTHPSHSTNPPIPNPPTTRPPIPLDHPSAHSYSPPIPLVHPSAQNFINFFKFFWNFFLNFFKFFSIEFFYFFYKKPVRLYGDHTRPYPCLTSCKYISFISHLQNAILYIHLYI